MNYGIDSRRIEIVSSAERMSWYIFALIIILAPIYLAIFRFNEFRPFIHLFGIIATVILYIITYNLFYRPNSLLKTQGEILSFIAIFLVSIYPLYMWFSLLGILIPLLIIIFLFIVFLELDSTNQIHWKQILIFLGGLAAIVSMVIWLIEDKSGVFDFYIFFSFQVIISWLGCTIIFIIPSSFPRTFLLFDIRKRILLFVKDHYIMTQTEKISLEEINHIVVGLESRSRSYRMKIMSIKFYNEKLIKKNSNPIKKWDLRFRDYQMIPSVFLQLVNIIKSFSLWLTVTDPISLSLDDFQLEFPTSNRLSTIDFATYQASQAIERAIQEIKTEASSVSSKKEHSTFLDANIADWLPSMSSNYQMKQLNGSYFLKRKGREKKGFLSVILFIPVLFGVVVVMPPFVLFRFPYSPLTNMNFENVDSLFPLLTIGILLLILIFLIFAGLILIISIFGRVHLTFEGENLIYSFKVFGKQIFQRIIPKKLLINVECGQNRVNLVFLGNSVIYFWKGDNKDRIFALEALRTFFY